MSNTIDLFHSDPKRLTLAAASVSVMVDGSICPYLEPVEIVRSGWPDFSWARLTYNPAACTGRSLRTVEDIGSELATGKKLSIGQYYNGIPPGAATFSLPIFHGHVDSIETELSADSELVEVTASDFSATLKRLSVHGQRVVKADGSDIFLAGFDTVFNPDSNGNAAATSATVGGRECTAFCAEPSRGRLWSSAEVIDYLLCEYVVAGQLHMPAIDQLKTLTEGQTIRDLDVTGLNLLEALHRCCERIGLEFKFVPRFVPTGPDQAIMFYKAGAGREVELNCQPAGQQFSISRTNVTAFCSKRNFWPITHRYIGQGDFKMHEATFELVKAWDLNLEDTDYDKFSPSTNPDFYQVKDVYRRWCLNEAGQYTDTPYGQGEPFDFSQIFGSNGFAQHRRRLYPALSTDKQRKSLGYFLQVSFGDFHDYWWQYLHAFNILLDECGIWLSSDQLDVDTWFASLRDDLRFRITATVISDERLACTVADGPVNSVAPVVEHVMTLPRQFKYRKVSAKSIFADAADDAVGIADEADDSNALHQFVRRVASTSPEVIETFDVQTPSLAFDYQLGDMVVTSPESRDLLACRSDNRSRNRIVRVQMDFRKQCTNLRIVRLRRCDL